MKGHDGIQRLARDQEAEECEEPQEDGKAAFLERHERLGPLRCHGIAPFCSGHIGSGMPVGIPGQGDRKGQEPPQP